MTYRPPYNTTDVTSVTTSGKTTVSGMSSPLQRADLPQFKHVRRPVRRARVKVMSARLAFLLSFVVHLTAPFVLGALALMVMLLLGMDLSDLSATAKPKPRDIEFVLVPENVPVQKPKNMKTPYRAEHNTRANGLHRPDRPVNLEKQAQNATPAKASMPMPPAPVLPKPEPMANKPQHEEKPQTALTAPIESKPGKPQSSPAKDSAASAQAAQQSASTGQPQSGSLANGAGNNTGLPSVDALQSPDFGPYMKALQIRIKQAWQPPRGNESKRVVVWFHVSRDGGLKAVEVSKTSGEPTADQAALEAIEDVFPFRPLPKEFADEGIDIEFTFDYNVFGDKQRLKRRLDNG